jgi:hypothetical protein
LSVILIRGQKMATPLLDKAIREAPPSVVEAVTRVLEESHRQPTKAAFFARSINALMEVSEGTSLVDVVSAPTDPAVLLGILERPEVLKHLAGIDPLMPARIRGIRLKQELLNTEGGVISSEQVAKLLNLTRQGVDKRRASGKLIGVSMGRRGYAYPLWQFQDGQVLSGLETVLKAMKEHTPWTQVMFMLTGDLRLEGETPLVRLRQGDIDSVVQAARSYGEQGAA